jgi:hypothetical protein
MSKRCARCKEIVVEGSNFCQGCGTNLKHKAKGSIFLRPFRAIWRKKIPIAVVLIFAMSLASLCMVALGYSRQRDIIRGEVSTFFNENKDQFKGDSGDRGSPGMNGANGSNGYGGSLNCSTYDYGSISSTNCY